MNLLPNPKLAEKFLAMDREYREAIELVRGAGKVVNFAGMVVLVAVTLICWVPTRGQLALAVGSGVAVWVLGHALVRRHLSGPMLRMLQEKYPPGWKAPE